MSNPQQTSSKDELAAEEKVEFQLSVQVDPDLIKNFPADVAQDFGVLPLGRFGEKSLVLAADEELSPERLKELRKRFGHAPERWAFFSPRRPWLSREGPPVGSR